MRVLLGISGSIAAYKIPELIRLLVKQGVQVTPLLTAHATWFVTPATLATVSESQVYQDTRSDQGNIVHLELGKKADLLVIAPATANVIAKCAHGIADDLLTSTFLSFQGPKLIVPAMHTEMYENPITQDNISKLKALGVHFLGPDRGDLACGDSGEGRLADLSLIQLKIWAMLQPSLPLAGKKVLISCGGTQEPLDSVRVLTNRATGTLGITLGHLASFFGAEVTLVSTVPVPSNPHLKAVISVKTAQEMHQALLQTFPKQEVVYMTAAVSDFTVTPSASKIRRQDHYTLSLTGTSDILKALAQEKKDQCLVGFCLADNDLEKTAQEKLEAKQVDFIVANRPEAIGNPKRSLTVYKKNTQAPYLDLNEVTVLEAAYQLLKLTHTC